MVTTDAELAHERSTGAFKGLKSGALGLVSSTVVGVASTAPAYSLAATLGFVIVIIGVQAPIVTIIAFIPMLFVAYAYKELNRADPDCGTVFTWTVRAFGPRRGWMGGWGLIAADVLVMASLAQVAGQYLFLLFNNQSIGSNATSGWVLLVGIGWIVGMTAICYVGIEVSANFQKVLLGIEMTMLIVLSVAALVKVGGGTAPLGHLVPSWTWFDPFKIGSFSAFVNGALLMLFIYWGWDTAVSVNEETKDAQVTPGRAAVLSTVVLLGIYLLVVVSAQAYAGLGTKGIGLGNTANQGDVLSVLGTSIFGTSGVGTVLTRLLILMVLSSAAASTQTTILPNARTTLSMAVYKAIPQRFAKINRRFLTPSFSTITMGAVSVLLYLTLNYLSGGHIIADSVSALGVMIAFYYGLTGLSCFWYYRKTLGESARNLWLRGILPLAGWAMLWFAMIWSLKNYWSPASGYTKWTMPFWPHWIVGGIFIIDIVALIIGIVLMLVYSAIRPPFFRGEVLNRDTPTLVPDDIGQPVGLFGVEPFDDAGSPPVTAAASAPPADGPPVAGGVGGDPPPPAT
ncbi:MAG TPA: APC family permease [Acidimicrobiales bacterium]|nr:APC family permease [Acidimicrobiales bacterium]